MRVDEHIAQLVQHGDALGKAATTAGLETAVPTCPDWTVRDLVAHQGQVHRWATEFVRDARTTPPGGDSELAQPPADDTLLDWYAEGHGLLVEALRNARDDLDCWSFLPAPNPRAFWARRQAHETAIHRTDAESAAGTVPEFDTGFAVDGLDELLLGFFARPRGRLVTDPPVTLGIRATDGDEGACWTVRIQPSDREVTRGIVRGDCIVEGRASDVYLLLWNRGDAETVSVRGDRKVLDLWTGKAQVRWS